MARAGIPTTELDHRLRHYERIALALEGLGFAHLANPHSLASAHRRRALSSSAPPLSLAPLSPMLQTVLGVDRNEAKMRPGATAGRVLGGLIGSFFGEMLGQSSDERRDTSPDRDLH
jgi:hypothetical protein